MNEIAKELIQGNIITIIIVIIGGILYLIKITIPALITKDLEIMKNENTKMIEKLKAELEKQKQKLEHIHQVSQPTYQKLFEKKIEIYQDLIEIRQKYKIKWKEKHNPFEEASDTHFENIELYFQEIKEIEKIIEGNQLYISNNLLDIYEKLIAKRDKFDSELDKLSIYLHQSDMHDIEYEEYERTQKQKINNKIYQETKLEFSEFTKTLDEDISKIKEKINLD